MITLLFGFTAMLAGGYFLYKRRAPIPAKVTRPSGKVLFTAEDIQAGQELFRNRDLMNYGSVLGHGAYLGPDYTAEALHWMIEAMQQAKSQSRYGAMSVAEKAAIDAEIARELRTNRYDAQSGELRFTEHQAAGWGRIVGNYRRQFTAGAAARALPKGALLPPEEGGSDPARLAEATRQFCAFVTWTAWLSTAKRPEANHSFTNNWPFDFKTTEAQHYRRYVAQQRKQTGRRAPLAEAGPGVIQRQAGINDGKGFLFISHTGDIFPSGFLPLSGGNVRHTTLAKVYREAPLFQVRRDSGRLESK